MRGYLILCDYAEQINGKINLIGGGFNRISYTKPGLDFSVAGVVYIPWNESNQKKKFRLYLVNQDGHQVSQGDQKVPVEINSLIEAGRPPGIAQGVELDFPFAFRFTNLELPEGRFTWHLEVDENLVSHVSFDVIV